MRYRFTQACVGNSMRVKNTARLHCLNEKENNLFLFILRSRKSNQVDHFDLDNGYL